MHDGVVARLSVNLVSTEHVKNVAIGYMCVVAKYISTHFENIITVKTE